MPSDLNDSCGQNVKIYVHVGTHVEVPHIWSNILVVRANLQNLAAGKSRIECELERHRSLGSFDDDQIIVLALEAGCGKVRGVGAQQPAADLSNAPVL